MHHYPPPQPHFVPPHPHFDYGYHGVPPEVRKRRRFKLMVAAFILFVLACGAALAALKVGLFLYQSPAAAKVGDSAANIGIVAADVAMQHYKVPDDARKEIVRQTSDIKKATTGSAGPKPIAEKSEAAH